MTTDADSGALAWEASPPLRTGAHSMLVHAARSTAAEADAFRFIRCWACEPYMGRRDERCSAQETLLELAAELDEQVRSVAEEEELGDNGVGPRRARRAARYTLYRKFVYVRWGYL